MWHHYSRKERYIRLYCDSCRSPPYTCSCTGAAIPFHAAAAENAAANYETDADLISVAHSDGSIHIYVVGIILALIISEGIDDGVIFNIVTVFFYRVLICIWLALYRFLILYLSPSTDTS